MNSRPINSDIILHIVIYFELKLIDETKHANIYKLAKVENSNNVAYYKNFSDDFN